MKKFQALPDLKSPVIVTKTFTLSTSRNGNQQVQVIATELVTNCLYLVREDVEGLKAGQVLSRNLNLTRESGNDLDDPSSHVFLVYDSLFDARRAFVRIDPGYRSTEIPELAHWQEDADWLLRHSWTLEREDEEGEVQFVLRASDRAQKHVHVRNPLKREAVDQTAHVSSMKDRLGRRNTGRIPLLCMAIERRLQLRTQNVRGIGRRMDWRTVVVEHYIDQLRRECYGIRRAVHYALLNETVFVAGKRQASSMKKLAERMVSYAQVLGAFQARPFSRTFRHVVEELQEASRLLITSAEHRDGAPAEQAKVQLERTYRSMCLLEQHWRLEEILMTVGVALSLSRSLDTVQFAQMVREIRDVLRMMTEPDSLTGQLLHVGFTRPDTVLVSVTNLRACLEELSNEIVSLKLFQKHLRAACKPL